MKIDRARALDSMRIGLVVLALAVIITGCAAFEDIGPRGLTEIKTGECFNFDGPASAEFDHVREVPCMSSHDGEVLGKVAFSEEEYPGEAWLNGVLANKCNRVVEDYFADTYSVQGGLLLSWIIPTEESWTEGFHAAICYASAERGKLRGSVK
jgi:hypothetical protein